MLLLDAEEPRQGHSVTCLERTRCPSKPVSTCRPQAWPDNPLSWLGWGTAACSPPLDGFRDTSPRRASFPNSTPPRAAAGEPRGTGLRAACAGRALPTLCQPAPYRRTPLSARLRAPSGRQLLCDPLPVRVRVGCSEGPSARCPGRGAQVPTRWAGDTRRENQPLCSVFSLLTVCPVLTDLRAPSIGKMPTLPPSSYGRGKRSPGGYEHLLRSALFVTALHVKSDLVAFPSGFPLFLSYFKISCSPQQDKDIHLYLCCVSFFQLTSLIRMFWCLA